MILKLFPLNHVDTAIHELPEPEMVVDPRPIDWAENDFKFEVNVNATSLIITRINRKENEEPGWVYSRNEFRYSFESKIYLFHVIKFERPPPGTTEIIFKDSIKTIRRMAFFCCFSLSKITIPNTIESILAHAFGQCTS